MTSLPSRPLQPQLFTIRLVFRTKRNQETIDPSASPIPAASSERSIIWSSVTVHHCSCIPFYDSSPGLIWSTGQASLVRCCGECGRWETLNEVLLRRKAKDRLSIEKAVDWWAFLSAMASHASASSVRMRLGEEPTGSAVRRMPIAPICDDSAFQSAESEGDGLLVLW